MLPRRAQVLSKSFSWGPLFKGDQAIAGLKRQRENTATGSRPAMRRADDGLRLILFRSAGGKRPHHGLYIATARAHHQETLAIAANRDFRAQDFPTRLVVVGRLDALDGRTLVPSARNCEG